MAAFNRNVYPVLLAGGSGTRLWPVSRELYPKQLVKFIGKDSLVQATVKRLLPLLESDRIRVVCGEQHLHEIARHLEDIGISPEGKVYCEPTGRNTAPAILLAAFHIRRIDPEAIMCIFPADHVIADTAGFQEKLVTAVRLADNGHVVTFGIRPSYPETGYGYVEGGDASDGGALRLKRFVEKPDEATARSYLAAGNFFWNSGMFAFKLAVILEEFGKHQPEMLAAMETVFSPGGRIAGEDYCRLADISIDYAIMEHTDRGVVLPSDFGWSDIGSWKAVYDFLPKDGQRNVIDGDVIAKDTHSCFIMAYERLIATNRISNLVVVETPDSIFVSDLDHSRDVKSIVQALKQQNRQETRRHRTVYFQWGTATLLERRPGSRVERLSVYPGAFRRLGGSPGGRHHLVVLEGCAELVAGGKTMKLSAPDAYQMSGDGKVHIENPGPGPLQLLHVAAGVPGDE